MTYSSHLIVIENLAVGIQVCRSLAANVECWQIENKNFKAMKIPLKEEKQQTTSLIESLSF